MLKTSFDAIARAYRILSDIRGLTKIIIYNYGDPNCVQAGCGGIAFGQYPLLKAAVAITRLALALFAEIIITVNDITSPCVTRL